MIPFFERLNRAQRILVAGCGGGFDVFAGVPLALDLMASGKDVTFANFSFTNLWLCGGERIGETMWRVDRQANEIPYFPEKWLVEWLARRELMVPAYAFAKSGVRPLTDAYRTLIERHQIDLVLLIDGGTDSVVFGDEPGVGTVVEDAVSIIAANLASAIRGEFGDFHATHRTSGSELFINPLMSQYWTFGSDHIVKRIGYAEALAATERMEDARRLIEQWRETAALRPRRPIPL